MTAHDDDGHPIQFYLEPGFKYKFTCDVPKKVVVRLIDRRGRELLRVPNPTDDWMTRREDVLATPDCIPVTMQFRGKIGKRFVRVAYSVSGVDIEALKLGTPYGR